jgi:RNA polymerase sigma-70 factor (ECF subfamily)
LTALRLVSAADEAPDELARVRDAVHGDDDARAWLAERWTPRVYRFLARMLGDDADAADVTQEVVLRALRHLDRYDPSRSFATWIFGIARNAAIDELRRRRVRRAAPWTDVADAADSPLAHASRAQRAEQVQRALAELPDMYREVLVLFHFEQLKYTEIADILEIPIGTVMNRIFRARAKLREVCARDGLAWP